MKLSIIIPYYSNKLGLSSLLTAIQLTKPPELKQIVVVDTSPDKSGLPIASSFISRNKQLSGIVIQEQLPIYEAWNAGIEQSKGMNCLIVNDDILIPDNFLKNLVKAIKFYPKTYCFVPRTPSRDFCGNYPISYFTWQSDILSDKTQILGTKWMPGFVFCLTNKCVKKVGLFDTNFKIWFGDDDYSWRIQQVNHIRILPDYVFHYGSKSHKYQSNKVKQQIKKDREYFVKKWKLYLKK